METKRAFVVAFLCMFTGLGVTSATTLEELFIQQTGWMPGIAAGSVQSQHNLWHGADFGVGFQGREFLEYHRELLAQSDDFRIYGSDADASLDPDAAVIPVIALECFNAPANQPRCLLKFEHPSVGGTCPRDALHAIDDPPHGGTSGTCHLAAYWTGRPANLQSILNLTGDDLYDYSTIEALGVAITRDFHNQGHGAIGRHQPFDMISSLSSVKDAAFYQWHKNIDNVYADWAVDKYQRSDKAGLPFFFSVTSTATGILDSALKDRTGSAAYQGRTASTVPARDTATQYGASARIASDIYVGDHATGIGEYKNLVYAAGTRKWGTASEAWDIDAWSVLNAAKGTSGWYFSVTKDSVGESGSDVLLNVNVSAGNKGGAVFESVTSGGGSNLLIRKAADLGLAPSDELDALEVDQQRQVQGTNDTNSALIFDRSRQWFSLRAPVTPGLMAIPDGGGTAVAVGPNDILRFDESGNLVITVLGSVLGLGVDDDLDALAIVDDNPNNSFDDQDKIYYSVTKQSTSMGANAGANIYCVTKAGAFCQGGSKLLVAADSIGLQNTDDLDALDYRRGQSGFSSATSQTASSILFDPSDTGACCHANGTCTEVLSTACVSPGDSFGGFDTVCAAARCASAPGACCAPNGSCTVVSDQACADQGGTFRAPGTTCPPVPACPVAPANDDCANAFVIPYNFVSPYDPPSDNTNATIPVYFKTPHQDDPPYSCNDHKIFSGPYGSGTIWYSYTVPPGSGSAPGPGIEMPTNGRSIYLSTQRAAQFYPNAGGAGDTRLAMYYAPNGDCSVLQEVACADNIPGNTSSLAPYAPLQYNNPYPGKYYIQVSTVFNVDRGQTFLRVSDPPPPATAPSGIPAVSGWGLAVLTLVLMGAGAILLRLRGRIAT